jgi:hypothetical protein
MPVNVTSGEDAFDLAARRSAKGVDIVTNNSGVPVAGVTSDAYVARFARR